MVHIIVYKDATGYILKVDSVAYTSKLKAMIELSRKKLFHNNCEIVSLPLKKYVG